MRFLAVCTYSGLSDHPLPYAPRLVLTLRREQAVREYSTIGTRDVSPAIKCSEASLYEIRKKLEFCATLETTASLTFILGETGIVTSQVSHESVRSIFVERTQPLPISR